MKQIKKLARRGMFRTLGLLGAIFLGAAVFLGLLSAGQGIEAMLIMILTMGQFLLIFLIFGLVGVVPYARVGKMVKRQCEELGIELDEDQEFEAVTKEISMSKNWLVSGLYGSNFALHRRSIDHVEETSYYQKGRTYPMILLYVGPKKKYKIPASNFGVRKTVWENDENEKAVQAMAGGDVFAGAADGECTGESGGGRGSSGGDIGSG